MKKGIIAIMVILCLGLMGFVGFMKFSEDNTPPEIQFQDNEIVYTAGDSYDGLLDVHAADHVQQRRFARAGSADDGGEFALFDRQVDAVQRPDLIFAFAKIFFQVMYRYNVHL